MALCNRHSNDVVREIAEAGTILQVQVGSGLYGTAVKDQDDRDEMGVCVEPPDRVIGLGKFDQYIFRTQPEHHRSGPGDLDLTVYSLRKWASLAAQGNPTVLMMLFAPREEWVKAREPFATELQACRSWFLSQQAGARFMGYLRSQRMRLLGEKSQRTNRPELIAKYGIDTKFAYHAVRLGWQGIELMNTGHITLPMPATEREFLVSMRTGAMTKEEILDTIDRAEEDLIRAINETSLPERPDMEHINKWLISTYQRVWEEGEEDGEGSHHALAG